MAALLEAAMRTEWVIREDVGTRLCEVLERHLRGESLTEAEIRAVMAIQHRARAGRNERDRTEWEALADSTADEYNPGPDPYMAGAVCVVPVEGVMCRYASMINGTSQPEGTHTEAIIANLDKALADPRCSAILLDFDSPGGTSAGMDDLATAIRDAGKIKPVVAYAHDSMCSAAYWAASQAGQCFASSVANVGSIGAYVIVKDTSAQAEKAGVKLHLVKAGEFKGAGAPGLPVTSADLSVIQQRIDALLSVFVDQALVQGRGMTPAQAKTLADGRVHSGADSMKLGLIDGVVGHRELLKRMNDTYGRGASPSASLNLAGMTGTGVHMTFNEYKISDPAGAKALEDGIRADIAKENDAKITAAAQTMAAKLAADATAAPASLEQLEAIFADGVPARDKLVLASLKSKHSPAQATAALNASLVTENAALNIKVVELDRTLNGIGPNGTGAPALKLTGDIKGGDQPSDYAAMVLAAVAADKRNVKPAEKLNDALLSVAESNPKAHKEWLSAGCPKVVLAA